MQLQWTLDFFTSILFHFNSTANTTITSLVFVWSNSQTLPPTLKWTKLNHLLTELFSRTQILMFFQKHWLGFRKKKYWTLLFMFKSLVEFNNKWFKIFIWSEVCSIIKEHELPTPLIFGLVFCKKQISIIYISQSSKYTSEIHGTNSVLFLIGSFYY